MSRRTSRLFLNRWLFILLCVFVCVLVTAGAVQAEVTVTDILDREVTIPTPINVAVISGKKTATISELPFMFETGRDRTITSRGGQDKGVFQALLGLTTPELTDGSVEATVALNPDVIFLKSYTRADAGMAFEETGVPVVYLSLESPADYIVDVTNLGKIFGEEARAQEILDYYADIETDVAKRVATVETKKRVLLLQYAEADGKYALKIAPAGWFQTGMIEMAGGEPVWKADAMNTNGWVDVNFEQIAAYDADVILIVNYFGDPKKNVAELKEDAIWQTLRAVQDGEIYAFGKDTLSWDSAGPRHGLGLLWTVKTLYPALTEEIDLTDEMIRFYSFFGLSETVIRENLVTAFEGK